MDSFLDFYPTQAIVLNIEMDHPDYFHDLNQIEDSFSRFLARTGDDGIAYLNRCDENVMEAAKEFKGRVVTFGLECHDADYCADEIEFHHGMPAFTLFRRGEALCRIQMHVPGAHNVCDALAVAAAAIENGIDPQTVRRALASFDGAGRRMDYRGKSPAGAMVYDDYAHHPTEITSTLNAAAAMDHKRLLCVFQPHTYSRTSELFGDFAAALAHPEVHEILLADIYSARETDTLGVSSALLADAVRTRGGNCRVLSRQEIIDHLLETGKEGDLILIMGAGDIGTLYTSLLA